jgi:hypothetical protein
MGIKVSRPPPTRSLTDDRATVFVGRSGEAGDASAQELAGDHDALDLVGALPAT